MSRKQELTDLTICRAVFAAWVFTYHVDLYLDFSHFLGPFAGLIRHGYLGVDGFFILSGLILARVHTELLGNAEKAYRGGLMPPSFQPPPMNLFLRFWGKRLARIYPIHLATILILAALVAGGMAYGWAPRDPNRFSSSSLLQNLFLVQGWGGSPHGSWNYPSWSISTEWAGYIVFPLVWYTMAYLSALVSMQFLVAGFAFIGLVFVLNGYSLNLTFTLGLFRFFPEFIVGMATARTIHIWADSNIVRHGFLAVGLVLTVAGAAVRIDVICVLGIWLVLYACLAQVDAGWGPLFGRRPVLNWLGRRSYTVYMTFAIAELLVSQYFRRSGWTPESHALMFAAGMLGITLILAVTLYALVETPCRRLADRWLTPAVASEKAPPPKNFIFKG